MPFTDIAGFITGLAQPFGNRWFVKRQQPVIGVDAYLSGVLARLQAGTRWPTDRLASKGKFKLDAFGCHPVKMWRYRQSLTIAAASIPALLVGEKENDIRLFLRIRHCVILSFWSSIPVFSSRFQAIVGNISRVTA